MSYRDISGAFQKTIRSMTYGCAGLMIVMAAACGGESRKGNMPDAVAKNLTDQIVNVAKNYIRVERLCDGHEIWYVCFPNLNRTIEYDELLSCRPRFTSLDELQTWVKDHYPLCFLVIEARILGWNQSLERDQSFDIQRDLLTKQPAFFQL